MGRAALGAAAKDKVIGVRVTHHEQQALAAKHGNPGRWLRSLIDEDLRQETDK